MKSDFKKLLSLLIVSPLILSFNNCARPDGFQTEQALASSQSETGASTPAPGSTTTTIKPVTTTTLQGPKTTTTVKITTTTVGQTTTTVKPATTTTTTVKPTTTTTLPAGDVFVPNPAPSTLPASNSMQIGVGQVLNTIPAQNTYFELRGAGSLNFSYHSPKWTQVAGPKGIFMTGTRESFSTARGIYGFNTPGVYDFKFQVIGSDGVVRFAYKRFTVTAANPVAVSSVSSDKQGYPTGVNGDFKTMSAVLYRQGQMVTTGEVTKAQVIQPRVYLHEHNGQGGERIIEVDRNTLYWTTQGSLTDTTCAADTISEGSLDSNKSLSFLYQASPSFAQENFATLYRNTTHYAGYGGGDLAIYGSTNPACRVFVNIRASIVNSTRAIDGSSLARHLSREVVYSLVVGN